MKPPLVPLILVFGLAFVSRSPAATLYVDAASSTPTPPFSTWATAAATIQNAIDAASPGDLVLVTNGLYQTGGKAVVPLMTNRVALDKAVTVQSVNGPAVTIIRGHQVAVTTNGDGAVRCAWVGTGAALIGFTLTNGATRTLGSSFDEQSGGGVWCETGNAVVSNCVMVGNSARFGGAGAFQGRIVNSLLRGNLALSYGGGAYRSALDGCTVSNNVARFLGGGISSGTLVNCLIVGNSANSGGGVYFSEATNCTVTANSAGMSGGGIYGGSARNCIVYFNSAPDGNFAGTAVAFTHSCTLPLPPGPGNFTNAPLFVNPAARNYQLHSNSPCINAGQNLPLPSADLAGNPRLQGDAVDPGAYEFQNPASVISHLWLQHHGLPTDGSVDYVDADLDNMNCREEWRCRTNPNDPLSVLALKPPAINASDVLISWQSVAGVLYRIERSGNPAGGWDVLENQIEGQPGVTIYIDPNAAHEGPFFYRIGID